MISSGVPTGLSFLATLLALDPNKIAANAIKAPITMAYDISASAIDLIIQYTKLEISIINQAKNAN